MVEHSCSNEGLVTVKLSCNCELSISYSEEVYELSNSSKISNIPKNKTALIFYKYITLF